MQEANKMLNETTVVREHADCGPGYRRLVLDAPRIVAAAQPGQFVHIRVPGLEMSALRRPISIFDAFDGKLTLLYKVVGRGTAALAAAKPGDAIEVLGPLGKGFPTTCAGVPLLVGGGYGVAPLHFLARRLAAGGAAAGKTAKLFIGGRTKGDLLALEDFAARGVEIFAATNDGSYGAKGFAVVPLDEELKKLRTSGAAFEFFACGPDGLLKAVAERARALGAPGWISCDRHMICGVGACYACIQRTTKGNARCCVDGPVFRADEILF